MIYYDILYSKKQVFYTRDNSLVNYLMNTYGGIYGNWGKWQFEPLV